MRADPRQDKNFLTALSQVAPGTALRAGIDDIIRAELGALIVIGDPNHLAFLFSGGMRLDLPFTSQLLYELAKMDGAIVLNQQAQKIVYANVQLMPDPAIPSAETGTRHRTAERVAKQTDALVISISQQRETVTVFTGDLRYQLGEISDVLARTNQALGTLETYKQRLDQGLTRLTALEFQSAVMLADVLGYPRDTNPLDFTVSPRGYRVLSRIPRLPDSVIRHVVRDFRSLDAVIRASHRDLEAVDGVGSVRAREIREGLRV